MKIYVYALLVILIFCKNSWAHQSPVVHSHTVKHSTDAEVQAITQLTHILHQAIEGKHLHIHSVKDFLKVFGDKEQWVQLLNFHRIARRTMRAFNMESNKNNLANHAKNLALLFPLSHFVEVMTAPAFVALGTIHEFPSVVIGLGGSLLSIIAIPGLDPLCILLLSAYPLKPIHKSVNFIRNTVEKSVKGIAVALGLKTLLSKAYTYEDRFRFIKREIEVKNKLNRLFEVELTPLTDGGQLSIFSKIDGHKILSLKRIRDAETNQFYIADIWISQTAEQALIRNALRLLSYNARSAVRELLKVRGNPQQIQDYEREFFVNQITVQEDGVEAVYKEKAISLRNKFQFKRVFQNLPSSCQTLLQRLF